MLRRGAAVILGILLLAEVGSPEAIWVGFKEGRRRAAEEGRPILVFLDLKDENSAFFLKEKFTEARVQELAKKFVLVRVGQGAREIWKRYGQETGPAVMLCNSNGDLLERGYWRSSEALYHAMKAALRKFGPVLAPAVRAEADALTTEIKRALGKKEYGAASVAAKRLAALTGENPYAERARITLDRLTFLVGQYLARGAEMEKKGRYYEALLEYEMVVRAFPGIKAAVAAREHCERFAKDERIRRLVAEQKDEVDSRRALDVANAKDAARPDLALEGWETLAGRWRDTPAGREAARLAWERRADPAAMARVREARAGAVCPSRISIARSYIDNGLAEKARVILESILEEHPGTSYVKIARELLDSIR